MPLSFPHHHPSSMAQTYCISNFFRLSWTHSLPLVIIRWITHTVGVEVIMLTFTRPILLVSHNSDDALHDFTLNLTREEDSVHMITSIDHFQPCAVKNFSVSVCEIEYHYSLLPKAQEPQRDTVEDRSTVKTIYWLSYSTCFISVIFISDGWPAIWCRRILVCRFRSSRRPMSALTSTATENIHCPRRGADTEMCPTGCEHLFLPQKDKSTLWA